MPAFVFATLGWQGLGGDTCGLLPPQGSSYFLSDNGPSHATSYLGKATKPKTLAPWKAIVVRENSNPWEEIVALHGPMVVQTAWRILGQTQDTEDVVQEAMWEGYRTLQSSPPKDWGAFLRVLVTRRAIDALRKRTRRTINETPSEAIDQQATDRPSPEAIAIEKELAAQLRDSVARLTDHEAAVFSLSCFSQLSNQEIAVALEVNASNVTTTLHRARGKLKEMLAPHLPPTFVTGKKS